MTLQLYKAIIILALLNFLVFARPKNHKREETLRRSSKNWVRLSQSGEHEDDLNKNEEADSGDVQTSNVELDNQAKHKEKKSAVSRPVRYSHNHHQYHHNSNSGRDVELAPKSHANAEKRNSKSKGVKNNGEFKNVMEGKGKNKRESIEYNEEGEEAIENIGGENEEREFAAGDDDTLYDADVGFEGDEEVEGSNGQDAAIDLKCVICEGSTSKKEEEDERINEELEQMEKAEKEEPCPIKVQYKPQIDDCGQSDSWGDSQEEVDGETEEEGGSEEDLDDEDEEEEGVEGEDDSNAEDESYDNVNEEDSEYKYENSNNESPYEKGYIDVSKIRWK